MIGLDDDEEKEKQAMMLSTDQTFAIFSCHHQELARQLTSLSVSEHVAYDRFLTYDTVEDLGWKLLGEVTAVVGRQKGR